MKESIQQKQYSHGPFVTSNLQISTIITTPPIFILQNLVSIIMSQNLM